MKSPEQQAKDAELENKDLIERTIKIPLTPKQLVIIQEISNDRQVLQDKLTANNKREQDIISFVLEFKEIDAENTEGIRLVGKDIVVVMKPKPKPEVKEEKEESKTEPMSDIEQVAEDAAMKVESNHK